MYMNAVFWALFCMMWLSSCGAYTATDVESYELYVFTFFFSVISGTIVFFFKDRMGK